MPHAARRMLSTPGAALLLALVALIVVAPSVAAHPLGAFSVNRLARLEIGADQLTVRYVVDMAEVPAFQERQAIDADADDTLSPVEIDAYAARRAAAVRDGLVVTIDGRPAPLTVTGHTLTFPPGQGGLSTLRLETLLRASLPAGAAVSVELVDRNEPDRAGWREIVAVAGDGRTLTSATVPSADRSDDLRAYPDDLLASPLDVRSARVTAALATGAPSASGAARAASVRAPDALGALITADTLTPMGMAVALLVAFGLGAVHALSPGHGKAVVAGYLVGTRGTARHALALGMTVTATHTIGVFALGLVTLFLSQYILPERLFPWLSAVSGVLVVTIGIGLLRARLADLGWRLPVRHRLVPVIAGVATRQAGSAWPDHAPAVGGQQGHDLVDHHHHDHRHDHDHDHQHHPDDGHDHSHEHGHDHQQQRHGWFAAGHDHGPGGHHHHLPERLTWRGLLALGISGGLVPCPSALVVLLGAIALQRVGFGLLLIVAFSAGLAAVLSGIGLLLVLAGRLFARLPVEGRALRVLPVVSAVVVTVVGLILVGQALVEAGAIRL